MFRSGLDPLSGARGRRRTRPPWPLLALLAAALSCGPAFGSPAATETPPPPPTETATAAPTPTPVPPDTPTPAPSATPSPDASALAQAQALETQGAALAVIEPDLRRYGLSAHQGTLGWMHRRVTLELSRYQENRLDVDYPDLSVADFVVQADITWRSTSGLAGCGFAVRAAPGLHTRVYYEMLTIRLSGAPLWFFVMFVASSTGDLIASGDAPTLNMEQDGTNTVAVVGQGGRFAIFVNGFLIGEAAHDALREGTVAFLVRHESGRTTCTFENGWLWVLRPASGVEAG